MARPLLWDFWSRFRSQVSRIAAAAPVRRRIYFVLGGDCRIFFLSFLEWSKPLIAAPIPPIQRPLVAHLDLSPIPFGFCDSVFLNRVVPRRYLHPVISMADADMWWNVRIKLVNQCFGRFYLKSFFWFVLMEVDIDGWIMYGWAFYRTAMHLWCSTLCLRSIK
jgi:hypothetical protein